MTEREMFLKSFERPVNYFQLPVQLRWEIDNNLGITDWDGGGLVEPGDLERYKAHYE